jgi:hypothetical protein
MSYVAVPVCRLAHILVVVNLILSCDSLSHAKKPDMNIFPMIRVGEDPTLVVEV